MTPATLQIQVDRNATDIGILKIGQAELKLTAEYTKETVEKIDTAVTNKILPVLNEMSGRKKGNEWWVALWVSCGGAILYFAQHIYEIKL